MEWFAGVYLSPGEFNVIGINIQNARYSYP